MFHRSELPEIHVAEDEPLEDVLEEEAAQDIPDTKPSPIQNLPKGRAYISDAAFEAAEDGSPTLPPPSDRSKRSTSLRLPLLIQLNETSGLGLPQEGVSDELIAALHRIFFEFTPGVTKGDAIRHALIGCQQALGEDHPSTDAGHGATLNRVTTKLEEIGYTTAAQKLRRRIVELIGNAPRGRRSRRK